MLIAISIVTMCIWLYLTLAHGGYWRIRKHLPQLQTPIRTSEIRIVAIVPARNEADVIASVITGLLLQTRRVPMEVVLVDDNSTDGTAQAALAAAQSLGAADRLHIISGTTLPPGWTGKMWALNQGLLYAAYSKPDYFLLTDADVFHEPDSIDSLLAVAEQHKYDLASYMVLLATATWAERLLIPAFVYFFFQLYPPSWIAKRRSRTAGAAGGCILIRAGALAAAGGIEAIKHEMIDDCALARNVKGTGGQVFLGLTSRSHSIRSYGSFGGVGRMIARSAFYQLKQSYLLLALTIVGLLLTYVAPVGLLCWGKWPSALWGGAAWLLMSVSYFPMVRFYRQPAVLSLLLPLIAIFYAGATIYSAWRYAKGLGGEWKGRIQNPRPR